MFYFGGNLFADTPNNSEKKPKCSNCHVIEANLNGKEEKDMMTNLLGSFGMRK
jgi:hypothetical protein